MKKKALVIGIDEYDKLECLNGCVNDAEAVAERLKSAEFGFDVNLVIGNAATRKAIRSALVTELSNADFTLIYFAGHGIRTNVSTFLATVDSEWDDEGIDTGYIVEAVSKLADPKQTVVIVLDCCHSGDASVVKKGQEVTPMSATDVPSLAGHGRLVMSACLGSQRAKEAKRNGIAHGRFTVQLLDALDGKAADRDKNVTIPAVYDYVASTLEKLGSQRPMLRGDQSGRIILGSGIEPTGSLSDEPNSYVKDEIIREAEEHIERYFNAIQQIGLKDYESRGHKEACQRLSPVIDWFQRRLADNSKLLGDSSFKKSWTHLFQEYQRLSNITTGLVLDKEREVGDFIGSGTFGSVWKIADPAGAAICFKSYHATELRDIEKVARFTRGYRAMTQLDHPNIVKVYESTVVPLGFYMQYIDGPNLRQYHPAGSCEIEQALEILLGVGETLSHAHGRNVLHRDVKPENILLEIPETGEIRPFLTDFDLSWFSTATKLTRIAGDGFGSHFYAAPEQMNAPASLVAHKPSVDAYSFGQVLFFTICGRDPAVLDESGNLRALSEDLSKKQISAKAASLLAALYQDCTIKNPEKRLSDFRLICDRLSKAITLCRTSGEGLSSNQFLQELRFLVNGMLSKTADESLYGAVMLKSPSGRTDISILIKKENQDALALEAVFIPTQSPLIGGSDSGAARKIVNARIDSSIAQFVPTNNAKRTAPKGGAYQSIVTFDAIAKDAEGLSRCRELLMCVVDCIERN